MDVDPPLPGLSSNVPDLPSPQSSEAPPSYSVVPPTNDVPVDFEGDHSMSDASEDSTEAPTSNINGHSTTTASSEVLEVLDRIPNLFRLLDLVEDRSSGGIVEKIVIDQKSLSKVINILQPGSYKSVSNIDFKALDNLTIKPIGVYGNQHEILNYLEEVGCLDRGSEQLIFKRDSKGEQSSALRSGLYLTMSRDSMSQGSSKTGYIFYWPEESTWDDQAASLSSTIRRNRETFMRYLTKLSEQTVALVSPSQAKGFIWETRSRDNVIPEHQRSADAESRLEEFQVFELDEQKEDAIASPGFKVSRDKPIDNPCSPTNAHLVPGDDRIGILTQKREEARTDSQRFEESISQLKLREIIGSHEGQPHLVLGKVSSDSMKILAANGLREKYPDPFHTYNRDSESLKDSLNLVQKEEKDQADKGLSHDKPMVAEVIRELVYQEYVRFYPSMSSAQSEFKLGPEIRDLIYARYYESGLDKVEKDIQQHRVTYIQNTEFRTLKTNWLYLKDRLDENSHLSETEKEDLVNKAAGGGSEHSEAGTSAPRGGFVARTARFVLGKVGFTNDHGTRPVNRISDAEFMRQLPQWEKDYPSLAQLSQPIIDSLHKDMKRLIDKLMGIHLDKVVHQERKARYHNIDRAREIAFKDQMPNIFESLLQSLKEAMKLPQGTSNPCIMRIDSITNGRYQQNQYSRSNNTWFYWRGEKHIRVPPQIHYNVYPLELTEHDRHQCQSNEDHVPKPRIASRQKFQFALAAASQSIEFIQIVQSKCLVVVSDSEQGHTRVFIEDNVKLSHATQSQGKITLYHDKLGGSKCFFAFDQGTRFLAVVHGENDLQVSVFEFDEQFSSLRRHRSPIDLTEWYDDPPEIAGVCFQTGRPELCLIETSGQVRVLSLVRRMFCGAPLEIDRPIVDIFPAPDGSCLLVTVAGDAPTDPDRLLAFHWQSFGPNQHGIDAAEVPKSDTRRVGTRFYGRGRIHVISFTASDLTLASTAVQVKQKTTEFAFLSENDGVTEERGVQTLNNSLIDCHMEVWTRFPVVPAVTRDTLISVSRQPRRLIFASPQALPQAATYFSKMISTLRNTTNKPVGEDLVETIVSSTNAAKFESFDDISEFKLGSYFVELICLIPLHLAITLDNKFLPLKDGVWDPDYESSLVGATITEVKDTVSLGWYESIFRTYMAKKLVRVVSSMGEQSVGKSYCLNHFADTSFAGSAMRTTEGVWLSCTPTKDYLLVSLDFEGMQSIERSAQEDMLLVLFNTAISNLVLFRNNFALSRNIRGLFTSFQSSAKTFDPSTNPGLFNSTLAIIIKDVTNADTNGIKKEFSLKFGEIVQMERDKNFISRLHRGKIQIIPWPVINSPEFYSLFNAVRKRLEMQDFTHQTGGAFLHKLKSLMVDIKTCNWNASDQSQASSRAHQLKERLTSALAHGKTAEGPLKNMNTDEDIPTLENEPVFFVSEIDNQEQAGPGENGGNAPEKEEELAEKALTSLIHRSKPPPASRPYMKESEYVEALQQGLNESLDHRLGTVEEWIKSNTSHFTLENPDLRELNKSFTIMSNAMQAAVKLCQACCSQCKLLCLRAYRHSGTHQCGTDHRCVFECEVKEEHEEQPPCGLEAGHAGRHTCDVRLHSCGKDCSLIHLKGCTSVCNKPLDHEGDCMCSARLHLCGKACELRDANQGQGRALYTCNGICHEPWDEPHTRHLCDDARRGCPIKCPVCEENGIGGDCSSTDHLHATDPAAVHLCSLIHKCSKLCEAKGICAIDQAPSESKTQFTGKHEKFVYTRFTQVSKRLPCEVPIPAGQLTHGGPHKHDLKEKPFHFCNAKCPGCNYFCKLPLDHPQKFHSTNHGSMVETKWIVEPKKDAAGKTVESGYKLESHKYGAGDEGAPMFCHMMCSKQGRHAHVDFCLDSTNHTTPACEHITARMQPEPEKSKDWISHATYWERTDPYDPSEQTEFGKCDASCAGPEHVDDNKPSRCTLPIFHPPQTQTTPLPRGYVSPDGHLFHCVDPSRAQQAYHVVFMIDCSGSMTCGDHRPLANLPVTSRLVSQCNNRYGAVVSALYGFLKNREAAVTNAGLKSRQDSYTFLMHDDKSEIRVQNDLTSTTEQLIERLIPHRYVGSGGNSFDLAITTAQQTIEKNWSADRAPMVVFLSDGECGLDRRKVEDLCKKCIQLGHALAYYGVSFGWDSGSSSLRQMADVADKSFRAAPMAARGAIRGTDIPCKYSTAIDSVSF
ncbi:von willebrand factor type A domain protein [Rhizoctonia solani 123E]|uniref:von willebrand factor type A domain protein n=1 Tax=Rhizoctonia solani 123E TaxID=1423351 RepID=A0A074RV07_9AGAM|nr:von willebrand factor type A domain protein [Rhizoctonia solani 123E]